MTRVLVLGGSSYVAQFVLQRHLPAQFDAVSGGSTQTTFVMACTMRGDPSFSAQLPHGFEGVALHSPPPTSSSHVYVYWEVDLGTMQGVRESIHHFRPSVVINCVAMSSPASCEKEPERAKLINEPRALIEFLAQEVDWNVHFLHFSTVRTSVARDFVYDGATPPANGYKESNAGSPALTVYGASKLAFDAFLLAQQSEHLSGVVLRIANVIGPQSPIFANQPVKFMEWLHQELFGEVEGSKETAARSLRIWSDEVRSFIYVRDLATIVFALLESDTTASPSRFLLLNIGGIDTLSRVELAERYLAACQRVDSENPMPRAVIAPTSRATVDLGYHPPLNARLDTAKLHQQLPALALTPSDRIMEEICQELLLLK